MAVHDPWTPWSVAMAIGTALGGGLVSILRHQQLGKTYRLVGIISELFIAGFTGSLAFWVVDEVLHQPEALCACIAAITGSMGGKIYDSLGDILLRYIEPREPPRTIFPPYGPDFPGPQAPFPGSFPPPTVPPRPNPRSEEPSRQENKQ